MELFSQKDIFQDTKENMQLGTFLKLSDPGKELLDQAKKTKYYLPCDEFVSKCLKKKPHDRCSIYQWNDEWKKGSGRIVNSLC